jgi:hypothetical protein
MGKEKKESMNVFAKGGTNAMNKQGSANPAEPGVSANKNNGPNDNKFGIGYGVGKGHMVGKQDASTAMAGTSSPNNGATAANNKWGLPPSKGHMAGHTGADPAKPA